MFKMYNSNLRVGIIIIPTHAHKERWSSNRVFVFRLQTLWWRATTAPILHLDFFTRPLSYFIAGSISFSHRDSSQLAPHSDLLHSLFKRFLFFTRGQGAGCVWNMSLMDHSPAGLLIASHTKLRPQAMRHVLVCLRRSGRTAGGRAAAALKFWCAAGIAGRYSIWSFTGIR